MSGHTRSETTAELSETALSKLRRECSLVASEVWVDAAHRVDFVGFRPMPHADSLSVAVERGEFVYVEVSMFIGWCDWVYEDVRRADACGEGRGVREFVLIFERGVDAAALAKGRHGFLPGKSRKNIAAFACMCDTVLARNAIEARYGFTAELRPLDGGEGR